MCILKVYSNTQSFAPFKKSSATPVYSIFEKGEIRRKSTGEKHTDFRISFDVSEKEWNDFNGQVKDAIQFLKENFSELELLITNYDISSACLDFPIYSRISKDIINQNDYLPAELISLAGKLSLGIEMSQYSEEAFDNLEASN